MLTESADMFYNIRIMMKFFKDKTGLGLFRFNLFIVLIASTIISAVIAIWAVIFNGFDNEVTFKVLGTSGVIAGASLLLVLLTMTLSKKGWQDYSILWVGVPSVGYLVFAALDGIYNTQILPNLFKAWFGENEYGYNAAYENITLTVFILTGLAVSSVFMRLVYASRASRFSALITEVLLSVWFFIQFLNLWFPQLFGVLNEWGGYDAADWWGKTQVVVGILVAVGVITTFVLEIVGRSKVKKSKTIEYSADLGFKTIVVDEETYNSLEKLASVKGIDLETLLKEYGQSLNSGDGQSF